MVTYTTRVLAPLRAALTSPGFISETPSPTLPPPPPPDAWTSTVAAAIAPAQSDSDACAVSRARFVAPAAIASAATDAACLVAPEWRLALFSVDGCSGSGEWLGCEKETGGT